MRKLIKVRVRKGAWEGELKEGGERWRFRLSVRNRRTCTPA